ncbi:type II secretion system protein GspL [uncultured Desulfosarcina sp.]|uniref:type II secretion system protein GspL n=1 Tax=uncultured Desulfosarcina sp. TaxID=218289 RepID=UPI0029C6BC3F|nr:type II secretion system protein GspL [uncultured Desulfosarcina sp.]
MSRKILGLDIREQSIAAVLLDSGFKSSQLLGQAFFPIPESEDDDDQGLAQAIAAVVEKLKPTGAACILGIPATSVSFRNLSVPFHDLKKIRQILPFELEPSLPLPVDELIFDFEAVKRNGHQDLLAYAARRDRIQFYLDTLAAANLNPVAIMPGGYAAARFIATMAADSEDFLLVDTGENNHAVYAVCSGNVRMVRSLPMALGVSPVLHSLEVRLRQTFTAAGESLGFSIDPSAVFATGPQSELLTGVNGAVTLLDLPVKSIEGIRSFPKLKGVTDTPLWATGCLDIALALALMETEAVDGVNFSTQRSTFQHYWGEYRSNIIFTAVLVALTLIIVLAGQFIEVANKQRQLAELDRRIEAVFKETFPEVTRVQAPLQQMQLKIKEAGENGVGSETIGSRVRVIDLLDTLSRRIPESVEIKISRLVVGADNAVLSGNTDTFNTVDEIKSGLEGAEIFKQVTISSADLDKSGQGVRFKLKMDY